MIFFWLYCSINFVVSIYKTIGLWLISHCQYSHPGDPRRCRDQWTFLGLSGVGRIWTRMGGVCREFTVSIWRLPSGNYLGPVAATYPGSDATWPLDQATDGRSRLHYLVKPSHCILKIRGGTRTLTLLPLG